MAACEALIVGSGPTGAAIAQTLIHYGMTPTMVDGGFEDDPRARALQAIARANPRDRQTTPIDKPRTGNPGGKTWFTSDAAYQQPHPAPIHYDPRVVARASYAKGGLSRVWGATFRFSTTYAGWPSECIPTGRDVKRVVDLVPSAITCWNDGSGGSGPIGIAGARASHRAMRAFIAADRKGYWGVEPSRVAIQTHPEDPGACFLCTRCLSGCPADSIWFAGDQIHRWATAGLLDYRPGVIVSQVEERDGLAVLHGSDRHGGSIRMSAKRIFLATGAISTSAILIRSGVCDSLVLKDTATAFLPAISIRSESNDPPHHHGLSQWWVAPRDDAGFLAQVYAPSREHAARISGRILYGQWLERPAAALAARIHPIIAYLDANQSPPLFVRRAGATIKVDAGTSAESRRAFSSYLRRLRATLRKAGYWIPPRATEFTAPGTGYHFGASMPHGSRTDVLGRPHGWTVIHIADASVLPSIEVGSITPTVMANAARIARMTVQRDQAA